MTDSSPHLTPRQAWMISALTGFLALSWEIVWMRLYNFTTASRAIAFGVMLGSYLLGLALGSLWSRRWQHAAGSNATNIHSLGQFILWSNAAAFLVVPVVSWLVVWLSWPWTLLLVMVCAASLGTVLPLLCHIVIPPDVHAGRALSGIYLANIIGSGAGSLLTGFVLMEHFHLRWLTVTLLFASCFVADRVGTGRFCVSLGGRWQRLAWSAVFIVGLVGMEGLWERLQYGPKYHWGMRFAKVIESKHGVITVDTKGTIYGNGTYDGALDTSLHEGSWLVRPYFIAGALHPKPKRVLVIGVSGGAWTQILAGHPEVEEIIGVEISDSYLRLIRESPSVSSLLANPKVKLVVDDGRRWLRHHPDERFDLIVMNTTHHWREFASALLSREFLNLAGTRLAEGGIVAWNCTESARAANTGMSVFPHTIMAMNFCVASRAPLVPDKERWRRNLEAWRIDGKAVLDVATADGKAELERVLAYVDNEGHWDAEHRWRWMNRARMEPLFGGAAIITDDNLGHEFAWGNW